MESGKVLTKRLLSQGYKKTKLVATLKKFYGGHHDLVSPYNVAFSRIVSDALPVTSHKETSKITDMRFYQHFLRSGLWAWWVKLAYQVMLTIRGRLITPLILRSMSVDLNILIRHSFTDLWAWITALVPWPLLLSRERPAILVAGKGRGGLFLFLLFLHSHSCSSFFHVTLFRHLYYLFYAFSPFLWETTQNDTQGLTCH